MKTELPITLDTPADLTQLLEKLGIMPSVSIRFAEATPDPVDPAITIAPTATPCLCAPEKVNVPHVSTFCKDIACAKCGKIFTAHHNRVKFCSNCSAPKKVKHPEQASD